ncbi:MAG: glycosyltransferase [Dysgonamonadaceae bacterium]|jgi:glycosyltransferase involved in cell wall biosynthesis|nr:glycosyltransferase [Dysgonamonadaceae bacterium]
MYKILHIPNYYPPHIGGIEEVCCNIISATKDHFQHRVICFHDKKETQVDSYENVEVIRCGVIRKLFSQSISLSFLSELKKVIKEFHPDIIHFHTPNPLSSVYLLLALPERTKLILHWHSDIIEQEILYRFYSPIEQKLLKRADKIFTTSPTYFAGSKALIPFQEKIHTIPNTVNTLKLDKKGGDDKNILQIKELYNNKKIIFTFGRHVTYKGLEYLIKAAPLISNRAVIVIAGNGPLSGELKQMASAMPSIHFIGRVSDDELRYYLHASDIFAFPSITRNEAFGVALAEAMYCRLPAVTFTVLDSGVNWVSPNGETGIESPNKDIKALAEAIKTLIEDDFLRQRLGENAEQRVLKYFVNDAIKEDLISAYNDLC